MVIGTPHSPDLENWSLTRCRQLSRLTRILNSGDPRRFAAIKTLVKDHQLTLVWRDDIDRLGQEKKKRTHQHWELSWWNNSRTQKIYKKQQRKTDYSSNINRINLRTNSKEEKKNRKKNNCMDNSSDKLRKLSMAKKPKLKRNCISINSSSMK